MMGYMGLLASSIYKIISNECNGRFLISPIYEITSAFTTPESAAQSTNYERMIVQVSYQIVYPIRPFPIQLDMKCACNVSCIVSKY